MIHYLLYSLPRDDKIDQDRKWYFYGYLASLFVVIASIFAYILEQKSYTIITGFAGLIGFIVVAILIERHNKKAVDNDYKKYNSQLDALSKLLKEAEYDTPTSRNSSNPTKLNWYTKDKIKYLIDEFEKLSTSKSKIEDSAVSSLKFAMIPIISFAGGVIADKAKLETSIGIAFIVAMIVVSFWGITQLVKSFADEIFFFTSDYQARRIYSLLSDLYIRDFDESVPDNSISSPQSSNP